MNYFAILGLILFIYMNFWFLLSLKLKRNDLADQAWGLGFVLLAWSSFLIMIINNNQNPVFSSFLSSGQFFQSILVAILVSIWGVRLFIHIHLRYKRSKQEDSRYLKWRKEWGKIFVIRSYLQVFILQGFLLFLISLPILFLNKQPHQGFTGGTLIVLGTSAWLVGFLFQSISDAQLTKFVKNPINRGKIIQTGLWRYSRHPNYFGEVLMWWGIWIISVEPINKYLENPNNFITIIGPILITFLILKISGIPLLEERMKQKTGFEEYKRKTSVFVPWFPKK